MRKDGTCELGGAIARRFVRELDIGRKAQIAPFASSAVSLGPQSSDATVSFCCPAIEHAIFA